MEFNYPVGKFRLPATWTDVDRRAAIAAIEALPAQLNAAVSDLSDAQLDTPYRPGGWTVRQVVHHVADSHMNAFIRIRLALTEQEPEIKPYDQDRWSELLDGRTMPVSVSLTLLESLHARWTVMLRSLTPQQFGRTFQHPESGLQTVDSALALYAWHGRHHTAHITRLREREGWG